MVEPPLSLHSIEGARRRAVPILVAITCCLLGAWSAGPVAAREPPPWSYRHGSASVRFEQDHSRWALWVPDHPPPPTLHPDYRNTPTPRPDLWLLHAIGQASASTDPLLPSVPPPQLAAAAAATGLSLAPVLRYHDTLVVPRAELLLSLHRALSAVEESELLPAPTYTILRRFPGPTLLVAHNGTPADSFARAHALAAVAWVRAAQPNFALHLAGFSAPAPRDPLFPQQWHLRNLGQTGGTPGADARVHAAWQIAHEAPGITIAILDEGVDVLHEDLAPLIVPGFDATNQPPPLGLPGNAAPNDPHGTACAGLAAAIGDNGLGSSGVCWRVNLMPIRLGYGFHWTESAWVIDAITWAVDHGADVLSGSWGGSPPSVAEEDAIAYARTQGRGGLGSTVLFASGNNGGPVAYPAAYPGVIAVGATSPCDERKTPTSCDGETWWGSNHGPELALVAPGPGCWTTDISGAAGFGPGNYVTFGGTSAACPQVAGAVALLLGLLPHLTDEQVEILLQQTAADGVGPAAEDTPGWDPYFGWGRLDVEALLAAALAAAPAGVSTLSCSVQGTAAQLSWAVSNPFDAIEVRRDGELIATLVGGATQFSDLAPTTGGRVLYQVQGRIGAAGAVPARCTLRPFVRGDVNADGVLALPDPIALLGYLFLTETLRCADAGDVNDSGALDLLDVILLLAYLFNGGVAPLAPFPAAGFDPTGDPVDCRY